MDSDNLREITNILQEWWETEDIPQENNLADVVTIYKKGRVDDPANYRPISLLQSLYKIFAIIIQQRLAAAIEPRIWQTQYGFRKARSTTQPLYIARRLQDTAEESGEPLLLALLDWEKGI